MGPSGSVSITVGSAAALPAGVTETYNRPLLPPPSAATHESTRSPVGVTRNIGVAPLAVSWLTTRVGEKARSCRLLPPHAASDTSSIVPAVRRYDRATVPPCVEPVLSEAKDPSVRRIVTSPSDRHPTGRTPASGPAGAVLPVRWC